MDKKAIVKGLHSAVLEIRRRALLCQYGNAETCHVKKSVHQMDSRSVWPNDRLYEMEKLSERKCLVVREQE